MADQLNTVAEFEADQAALEDRRQALIRDIMKQRESALAAFDAQLARLGHQQDGRRRSHHCKQDAAKTQKPTAISRKPAA
jgi:hypothetical protein